MPWSADPSRPAAPGHAAGKGRYDAVSTGESDDPGSRYGWSEECGNNEKRRERPGVHGRPSSRRVSATRIRRLQHQPVIKRVTPGEMSAQWGSAPGRASHEGWKRITSALASAAIRPGGTFVGFGYRAVPAFRVAKYHWQPSGSRAVYRRSPHARSSGSASMVAPAARARRQCASTSST